MSAKAKWSEFQKHAEAYAALVGEIEEEIRGLSDEDLAQRLEATKRPSSTNCWWAVYDVAKIMRHECEVTIEARRRLAIERDQMEKVW